MKIKKAIKVLLSCMLAGALFTGCGGGDKPTQKPAEKPAETTEVKLGMITYLNANEKRMEDILDNVTEKTGVNVSKYKITFYDNLNNMQMGIESGSVEQISLYKCVANYVTAINQKFEVVPTENFKLSDSFCFAVRKEDAQLKADLDKAIDAMKADGTLDKLIKTYITDINLEEIPAIEIPLTEGAETINVGVTGDLPPLDYVSANGMPAGFNTAVLEEISKRLGKNINVIDIDSGARSAALTSKKIDVIFWAILPAGDKVPADIDKPEGVEFSKPYYQDEVTHLKFNK